MARDILSQIERIRIVATSRQVVDAVSIGCVATVLPTGLPTILRGLQARYPEFNITVKFASSEELAQAVVRQELDFKIQTTPREHLPGLFERDGGRPSTVCLAGRRHQDDEQYKLEPRRCHGMFTPARSVERS